MLKESTPLLPRGDRPSLPEACEAILLIDQLGRSRRHGGTTLPGLRHLDFHDALLIGGVRADPSICTLPQALLGAER